MALYSQQVRVDLTITANNEPPEEVELCELAFQFLLENPIVMVKQDGTKMLVSITAEKYQAQNLIKQEVN